MTFSFPWIRSGEFFKEYPFSNFFFIEMKVNGDRACQNNDKKSTIKVVKKSTFYVPWKRESYMGLK